MATPAMADAAALRRKGKDLTAEAVAILEKIPSGEAGAEEQQKVEGLLKQAEDYRAKAVQSDRIAKLNADFQIPDVEQPAPPEDQRTNDAKAKFSSWGEWLKSAHLAERKHVYDDRLSFLDGDREVSILEAKALAEGVGATGGFLVPAEFRNELLALLGENSIVRSRANVIRMSRQQLDIPVLDQTTTTAGQPHWYGGMIASWTAEAAQKAESDPAFRMITLVAHELVVYTRVSDSLLADSAQSLEDFLTGPMGFPGAIGWQEDYTFLNGTGAGQPLGIINAGATITVNRAVAGPPAAIGYADLASMLENFMPNGNGVWLFTQSALAEMLQLSGPTGNPSFIWGSAVDGAPNRLLGRPVIFTEKLPAIGTAGDVLLCDFRNYIVGDRQNTAIDSSTHERFQNNQTTWRAVHRVDGQPQLSAPITLQDGTSQISPFVMLGAKTT